MFFFSCQKRSLKELMIHRIQALLQPIVFFSILNYFITIVVTERSMDCIIGAPWIKQLGSLWFLWSVLSASVVIAIASKVPANRVIQAVIVLLGFGFVCLFPNWEQNICMYPYFLLGFLFAKFKDSIPVFLLRIKWVLLLPYPIALFFYYRMDISFTNGFFYGSGILSSIKMNGFQWLLGISGSVFVLLLIEIIHKGMITKKPIIAKPISSLGKKSLQVYCISVSLLSFWLPIIFGKVCGLIGRNIFVSHMWFYNFVLTPIIAVVYAVLIYYFVKLLEKIKVGKLIFGR